MHKWAARLIREHLPRVTTLVSYSDPTHGHTGALYRACNWQWAPTWVRLRPPPSGHGEWGTGQQGIKDRWVFCVAADDRRADVLAVDDPAAIRYWQARATDTERAWAKRSLNLSSVDVELADRAPGQRDGVTDRLNGEPLARHLSDDSVSAVHAHIPSRPQVEKERRIGLAPVKSHDATVTPRGAA